MQKPAFVGRISDKARNAHSGFERRVGSTSELPKLMGSLVTIALMVHDRRRSSAKDGAPGVDMDTKPSTLEKANAGLGTALSITDALLVLRSAWKDFRDSRPTETSGKSDDTPEVAS